MSGILTLAVTKLDELLSKKRMQFATSSGWASRFSALLETNLSKTASGSPKAVARGVSTTPLFLLA